MNISHITSVKNPKIKHLQILSAKSRERRESGCFIVEGKREILAAVSSGFEIDELFFCEEILSSPEISEISAKEYHSITKNIYSKLAYRDGTEGVIAVFKLKTITPDQINLSANPLVIILESVEKPGNLGAVIRTADAAGADAVIICDPLTDIYNPNVIRSSIGGVFSVNTVACSSNEAYNWLKRNNIKIFTTELEASCWYHQTDLTAPSAIVLGTESLGLKPFWRERADERIKIPMNGKLDSLNVSVSAAIISFEAMRQRGFKKI